MTSSFWNVTTELLGASVYTLGLFALTIIFAVPLGFVVYLLANSKFKPLSALMRVLIWIIRGTPLMLQIILFVFAPGLILQKFIVVVLKAYLQVNTKLVKFWV